MGENMVAGSSHCSWGPLLKLDVGGKVLVMAKESLDRFPTSLIADLVKACPEVIGSEKPLFIDRNPKGFEIILDIYRLVYFSNTSEMEEGNCVGGISGRR